VARLAAERVGPEGLVTGLDMNPGMLAVAHSVTAAPVDWRQGNAEAMDLPDGAYDAVLCQLGLQFFPDLPAALREQRRVLASGGRFVASTPGPTPGLFAVLEDELRDHVGAEATAFVRVVFRLHEPDTLHDLLADAGFDDVAVHRRRYELRLPSPAEFLWQYVWSTPLAAVLTELDDARRAAFERDIVMQWERFTQDDRLLLELDVLYAAARVRGSA
jgi:SAM-dependent methyltransferase